MHHLCITPCTHAPFFRLPAEHMRGRVEHMCMWWGLLYVRGDHAAVQAIGCNACTPKNQSNPSEPHAHPSYTCMMQPIPCTDAWWPLTYNYPQTHTRTHMLNPHTHMLSRESAPSHTHTCPFLTSAYQSYQVYFHTTVFNNNAYLINSLVCLNRLQLRIQLKYSVEVELRKIEQVILLSI